MMGGVPELRVSCVHLPDRHNTDLEDQDAGRSYLNHRAHGAIYNHDAALQSRIQILENVERACAKIDDAANEVFREG